jgi:hypothetical protein
MIYSIQSYLENYFNRCGLVDPDQYAVNVARLYDRQRHGKKTPAFLSSMKRIHTVFYKQNARTQRPTFEKRVLTLLDSKFKKKRVLFISNAVAERVEDSGNRLRRLRHITIRKFLEEFKSTVEAHGVNSFWESRSEAKLRSRAEKIGQEMLGVFASAKLRDHGAAIREPVVGTGFVDFLVTFSSGLVHVVELKMLKDPGVTGLAQLAAYMKHNNRKEGWLVLFDVRKGNKRQSVAPTMKQKNGTIRTVVIDLNPTAPSKLPDLL